MSEELSKYLWDILEAIGRLEKGTSTPITYQEFIGNALLINAIERNFEIIGEALTRALQQDGNLPISNTDKIIGLRNIISHNYDGVEAITLWGIVKKDVPILKSEVKKLLQNS